MGRWHECNTLNMLYIHLYTYNYYQLCQDIMGVAQRAWHHHMFLGVSFGTLVLQLFYLGFLPMWNANTSMFEGQPVSPPNNVFFANKNVCLQVCMHAKSYESHVYYVYFIRYLYMMTYISILISPIHIWIWLYVYVCIIQNLYLLSIQDDANPTDLVT